MRGLYRRAGRSQAGVKPHSDIAKAEDDSRSLLSGMKGWVGALQLSAFLIAMGFIGKLAHQQFLGVETGSWTALDLSLFAGRWAADTLTVTLQQLFTHPYALALPLALYLTPSILSWTLPEDHRLTRPMTFASLVLVAAGVVGVLSYCEMPTVQMNDWLTSPLSDQLQPAGRGVFAERLAELRVIRLVSRMEGVAQPNRTGCAQKDPPALLRQLRFDVPAAHAQAYLDVLYACSVLICVSAWFSLYFHASVSGSGLVEEIFRSVRAFVLVVLLPVATCFLPYIYAKLIYPTSLPIATVTFAKDVQHAKAASKPKPDGKTPENKPQAAPDAEGVPAPVQYLIVDETEKELFLISTDDLPPALQRWRREDIREIQQYGNKDVVNELLQRCDWLPTEDDPAKQGAK